jgi:Flp pilus assembly protein TadG
MDSQLDHRKQSVHNASEPAVRQEYGSTIALLGCKGSLRILVRSKTERGATLVEFALVVMLFMVMVLGIIDFSRALYIYHFLSNSARDATRWTAVNGSTCGNDNSCNGTGGMNMGPAKDADIIAYVKNRVPTGIDASLVTVQITWPMQTDSPPICNPSDSNYTYDYPGCTVQVQVSYPLNFIFPLIHSGTLMLSSTSEMIIVH